VVPVTVFSAGLGDADNIIVSILNIVLNEDLDGNTDIKSRDGVKR
jgi:hypothetical protein